jgi:hypothetical protein
MHGVDEMKIATIAFSASLAALALAAPAAAQTTDQGQSAEIMARGPDDHAATVRIDGQDYAVCTHEGQDSCIEPYAAGLDWGNRPLDYWPGRPASEIAPGPAGVGG